MDSLPAPCPGDHWPRGCGDGSAAVPVPGRCASCCPPARRRRWPRARWPCAATPGPSSTRRRCAWRSWSRPSGAAAAATRRSPTSLRGLEAARPPHERLGPRRRGPPRRREPGRDRGALRASSSGRSRAPCASASTAGRAPTSRWPPAGRPSRRSCGCRARARAPTWCRTTSPSSTPTSAEREWAAWTYRQGLHCIAASPWLAELVRTRYGAGATSVRPRHRPRALPARRRRARATTASSSTRAPSPRGAPCRWACSRWPSCTAAGPRSRSRSSARRARSRRPSRIGTLGVLEPDAAGARLLRGDRRARAVAHQPLAHPPGDAGLRPAVRRRGQREHARHVRRRRPGDARGARAGRAVRGHRGAARRPRAARPSGRRRGCAGPPARTWPAAAAQVQEGLRAAVREAAQP